LFFWSPPRGDRFVAGDLDRQVECTNLVGLAGARVSGIPKAAVGRMYFEAVPAWAEDQVFHVQVPHNANAMLTSQSYAVQICLVSTLSNAQREFVETTSRGRPAGVEEI
jgi:hypothetical protein